MEAGDAPPCPPQPGCLPLFPQAPAPPWLLHWGERASRAFPSNIQKTRGENKPPHGLVGKHLAKWFAGHTLPAAVSRREIPPLRSIHGSGDPRGQGWPQNPGWESKCQLAWAVGTSSGVERRDEAAWGVPSTIPPPALSPAFSPLRPGPDQTPGSRHPHGCTHKVLHLHQQ